MTELQRKWIEALRSGKYKQGKGRLKKTTDNGDLHCCLGVVCEILNPDNFIGGYWNNYDEAYYLDEKACADIGLSFSQTLKLSGLNDSNFTFDEIADVIECMFKGMNPENIINAFEARHKEVNRKIILDEGLDELLDE